MLELFASVWQLITVLASIVVQLLYLTLQNLLLVVYVAWALLAVNWPKVWPTLKAGAWAPLVLIVLIAAMVWTFLEPMGPWGYWWHLGGVSLIVAGAFFCGWLQVLLGWTPPDLSFEPNLEAHGDHGHH